MNLSVPGTFWIIVRRKEEDRDTAAVMRKSGQGQEARRHHSVREGEREPIETNRRGANG